MNREAVATGPIPTKADYPRVIGFSLKQLGAQFDQRSGQSAPASRNQLAHARFGALEGVAQLVQIGDHGFAESAFDVSGRDSVMADQEGDVRHVLGIVAPHHLGENQVQRGGAEQPKPACRRARHRNEVLLPIAPEKDLVSSKEVGEVESLWTQLAVGDLLSVPEAFVSRESIQISQRNDGVHVL